MAQKKILIETKEGERQLVDSMDGHEGGKILGRDVEPLEFASVQGGKLVEDEERKANAKKREDALAVEPEELMDRLEALEARVAKLEASNG